jgi:hypothetical protein
MGIGAKIVDALTGGIGGKILDTIDKFVPDKDLRDKLKHALSMAELTGDLDLQKVEIEAERDTQIVIEQTHQAALNQQDLYTKRTRPKIARQSWLLCIGYVIVTIFGGGLADPFVAADLSTLAFDPVIFGTLAGPALWYMGMRGFDKWKNGAS